MFKFNNKINTLFINWLTISLILVFCIIIIGGLTRLTNSGLSITEWELFKGILPPIGEKAWMNYFESYKNIPQFIILNSDMTLSEFKVIFYWEYFHRILARIIGIFFLVPLIYFHFINKIEKKYMNICYFIFALILLQGVVGWYMVKSGLVNDITVSHYRLSVHLLNALIIISIIFWLILNLKKKTNKIFFDISKRNIPYLFLILLIFTQVVIGAFVSGLDAGKIYQTWPLMGLSYFPNDLIFSNFKSFFEFDNHSLVQFYHRNLAYLISIYIIFLTLHIFLKKNKRLYKPLFILLFFVLLQIFLGVLTLISGLNIFLASAHQIGSIFLVFTSINLYYCHIK